MRFFSNDAKETNDDVPDHHSDSPVVPHQRVGSPWSDTRTEAAETPASAAGTEDGPDRAAGEPDGTRPADDSVDTRPDPDDQVDLPLEERGAATGDLDADRALRDEGDFDEPHAVDPATDTPLEADTDTDAHTERAIRDEGDFDEPHVVDPATGTPVAATAVESGNGSTTYASAAASGDTAADRDDTVGEDRTPVDTTGSTAVVAAVPAIGVAAQPASAQSGPAKPGSVAEKGLDPLFGADAAKGFQERWRDVQLRFVDSPKDSTAEAAGLVDEAVDQLTSSLKAQKDTLLSDSDDTENLRLELRGYRDILNRILSL